MQEVTKRSVAFGETMFFQYYVGKSAGLRKSMTASIAGCEAGFYNESRAIDYAKTIRDGMNFILVYNNVGETIHTIPPTQGVISMKNKDSKSLS